MTPSASDFTNLRCSMLLLVDALPVWVHSHSGAPALRQIKHPDLEMRVVR